MYGNRRLLCCNSRSYTDKRYHHHPGKQHIYRWQQTNIFLGYGPRAHAHRQCYGASSLTYSWSPSALLSNASVKNPSFTPATPGTILTPAQLQPAVIAFPLPLPFVLRYSRSCAHQPDLIISCFQIATVAMPM